MDISVAVIPARGGSVRIPRKNIKPFLGKPSISYAIQAALEAEIFSEIVVSTDDEEIAAMSLGFGATKIIKRPDSLADNFTPTVPVISHAIRKISQTANSERIDVCCIYPLNPFVLPSDLIEGLRLLRESEEISYVNPVCLYPYPVQRAIEIVNSKIQMVNPEHAFTRSQDLHERYHDAGQWYWGKSSTWLKEEKLLFNSKPLIIPRWRCQDIDTEEDWKMAEALFRAAHLD